MNQEVLFAKTLEKVRQMAKEQGNCIGEQMVREEFAVLELSEEQLEMVFDYLKKHNTRIGEAEPDVMLSEEESHYLEEYLLEIALLTEASEEELKAVMKSAMAGEADARSRLIELFLPRVAELARLYAGQGVLLEDLIGEGNVALAMGVEMLGCLEDASEVQGMLGKIIMDAMEEAVGETLQARETEQKTADKINLLLEQARELSESIGKKVTVKELAEEYRIPEEEIRELIRMGGSGIEYLEKED